MKIRNRRKCLDYQMNTKEILEYPLLPPSVKIKRPYNFFSSPFSQLLCSRMIWWIVPVCSFVIEQIPNQVHICVHTNFLSPSYFVSPPYYVSSTNCLFISAFVMLNKVRHAGASVSLLGTLCFYFLSPD